MAIPSIVLFDVASVHDLPETTREAGTAIESKVARTGPFLNPSKNIEEALLTKGNHQQ
jgi:hypothetical protein